MRFKIVYLFGFYVCANGKQLLYHEYQAFLLSYAENIVIMRRIWILRNFTDPHHCILSDAMFLILHNTWHLTGCGDADPHNSLKSASSA